MKSCDEAVLEVLGDEWVDIDAIWRLKQPKYVTRKGARLVAYGSIAPSLKRLVAAGKVEQRWVDRRSKEFRRAPVLG